MHPDLQDACCLHGSLNQTTPTDPGDNTKARDRVTGQTGKCDVQPAFRMAYGWAFSSPANQTVKRVQKGHCTA